MATWTSEALRLAPDEDHEPSGLDLDGVTLAPSAARREAEARCVLCMAQHLLAASHGPESDAARQVAQLLETECPTCLARPGGGG